eukprot:140789_1
MELLDAASVGCPHQVWWSNNKVSLIGIRMFQKKTPISWYGTFGFEPADKQLIESGSEFFHKTATKEKTKEILDRGDPTESKWKKVEGIVKSVDVVWTDQSLGELLSDVYTKSCVVYQELLWFLASVPDIQPHLMIFIQGVEMSRKLEQRAAKQEYYDLEYQEDIYKDQKHSNNANLAMVYMLGFEVTVIVFGCCLCAIIVGIFAAYFAANKRLELPFFKQ